MRCFARPLAGMLLLSCFLNGASTFGSSQDLPLLWTVMTDPVRTFEARHRAFLELTRGIDALTHARGTRSGMTAISQCAGFSILMEAVFRMNTSDPLTTLAEAGFLLAQTDNLYAELNRGMRHGIPGYARPLGDPIRRVREHIESIMTTGLEHAVQVGRAMSPEQLGQAITKNELKIIRRNGIRLMAGLPMSSNFNMPDWLSFHSGNSKRAAPGDITHGTQNPSNGYVQLAGDPDATGRHEHLIAMAAMGWATETLSQEQQLQKNTVNAALYTQMGNMAPEKAENGPGQNHSPTDLKVNREGIQLGRALAYNNIKGKPWPAGEMNRRVFMAICDESQAGFSIPGPLSVDSLSAAFSSATLKLPPLK